MRDNGRIVKPAKKATHFTITDIGGPDELKVWKEGQRIKEVHWQITKASKRQAAIDAFNRGKSSYEGQVSKTTETHKRHAAIEQELQLKHQQPKDVAATSIKKYSMKSLIDRFLGWFMSIKF